MTPTEIKQLQEINSSLIQKVNSYIIDNARLAEKAEQLRRENLLFENALWKACGDDKKVVLQYLRDVQ